MPLRLRLAILNGAVLAGAILLLSFIAYAQVSRSLAESLDESLRAQGENLATLYEARAALASPVDQRVIPQPGVFSSPTFLVQVLDPDGNVAERSSGLANRQLPVNPESVQLAGEGHAAYETVVLDGQPVRLYTSALTTDEEFLGYLQVARSLQAAEQALAFLRTTLLQVGAASLAIALIAAWFLAGASLHPITRITRAAGEIAVSGRFDRRLARIETHDEVARLTETFNRMMDRLESSFTAQRRFVADASHELRTPLTIIRGNIEMLRRSGSVENGEMQEALDDVIAESERMTRLVGGLLALARADAGQEIIHATVQLDQLVDTVQREVQPAAGKVAIELGTLEPVEVEGDLDALKQLLLILVDNGVKYTPDGGTVTMSVRHVADMAEMSVRDTGPGIAEEDLPNIFERFYRATSARGEQGTGLGLAIALWIANAHGGNIAVDSVPDVGSCFTVRLPLKRKGAAEPNGSDTSGGVIHTAPLGPP